MRIEIETRDEKPVIVVSYKKGEWEEFVEQYENLGLKLAKTENGFGKGLELKFYRDSKGKFIDNMLGDSRDPATGQYSIDDVVVMDNMNASVISNSIYNIALFRVAPDRNGEVVVPMGKFTTLPEIKGMAKVAKYIGCIVLDTIVKATISLEK